MKHPLLDRVTIGGAGRIFTLTPACLKLWRMLSILTVIILLAGGYSIGSWLQRNISKKEAAGVFYRVRLAANSVSSVIGSENSASSVQRKLSELTDGADMRLTVTDGQGNLIADTHSARSETELKEAVEMKAAISGRWGHAVRKDGTDERIFFAIPVNVSGYSGIVRGGVSTDNLDKLTASIRFRILMLILFLSVAIMLVSRILIGMLSRRLAELEQQMDKAASGDAGVRMPDEGADEIAGLGRNSNRLVSRLRDLKTDAEISRCRLTTLLENSGDGYIIIDGNFKVLELNEASARLTGCSDLRKGSILPDLIKTPDFESKIAEAMAFEQPDPVDLDFSSSGGSQITATAAGLKLHHKGSSVIVCLSEHKEDSRWMLFTDDILPDWMRMVRKLDKNFKRFKNGISETQNQSRANLAVEASVLQIKILTRNLSSWIKDDPISDSVKVTALDILDTVNGSIEILRPILTLRDIRIENTLSDCVHRRILAQEHLFKSAVIHLLYMLVQPLTEQSVVRISGEISDGNEFGLRLNASDAKVSEPAADHQENSFLSELDRLSAVKLLQPFQGSVEFSQNPNPNILVKIPFVAPAAAV